MQTWQQLYSPLGSLGLSALAAVIPIVFFFLALAVFRLKGHVAGSITLALSILVAIFAFQMPVDMALAAAGYGFLYGLWPIAWIIVAAVFLYKLTVKSGQFEVIRSSVLSITDDQRLQVLLIGFCFGAFLEGAAGFGAPVAITAALLVGLGFNPLYAAGLCLIANTAPVAFGALGIPIIVAGQVTGIDAFHIGAMTGRQLPLLSLFVPFWLVFLILTVLVTIWTLKPFKAAFAPGGAMYNFVFNFAIPHLDQLVIKTAPIVAAPTAMPAVFKLDPISATGTAIFLSALISMAVLKINFKTGLTTFKETFWELRWPILSIGMVLAFAFVTNYSGMSSTMALVLAGTGAAFPFFSPFLGWLGVFLTGSDTSSNALFSSLQATTAHQIGVSDTLLVAANTSGGVTGKMISPQSIAVACAATGLVGKESDLFRFTVKHSLFFATIVGLITLVQAYWLTGMLVHH